MDAVDQPRRHIGGEAVTARLSPVTAPLILVALAGGTNVLRDLVLLALAAAGLHPLPLYGMNAVPH